MGGLAEAIKGVKPGFVVKEGGRRQVYLLVDLSVREPGRVSLERLAKEFGLPPRRVIDTLLSGRKGVSGPNAWALEELYQAEALYYDPGLGLTTVPSAVAKPPKHNASQKRGLLSDAAHGSTRITLDGKKEPPYFDWTITNSGTIALPLSKGFRTTLERYKEYKESKPELDAFAKLVAQLGRDLDTMRAAMRDMAVAAREAMSEIGALAGLEAVVDIECAMVGDPLPGEHAMADLQGFIAKSAMPVLSKNLVLEPVAAKDNAHLRRDGAAKRILDSLKTPEWKEGIKALVEHHAVAEHQLWDDTFYYLEQATFLLPMTGLKDRFSGEQIDPLIYHAWKAETNPELVRLVEENFSEEARRDFLEGWKDESTVGESVVSIASTASVAIITSGSNMPGPMSLWVAATRLAMFYAIEHKVRLGLLAKSNGAAFSILNLLARGAKLNVPEWDRMLKALNEVHYQKHANAASRYKHTLKAMKIDWDGKLFRGSVMRGGTAVVATILLLATLTGDPLESVNGVVGLASAFGTAGLAIADLKPVLAVIERNAPRLAAHGLPAVAGLLSVVGVVTGFMTLGDGWARGDMVRSFEGGLGGTGSLLSLVGWVALESSLVTAVALPHLLMVAGAVLVLAAVGVGVYRMLHDSVEVFAYAILEELEREDSFTQRAGLGATTSSLRDLMDVSNFKQIPLAYRSDLEARGFTKDLIAELTA